MATVLPFPVEARIERGSSARARSATVWALRGPTLGSLLADGPFPRRQAALAIRDICHAVESLHGRGVAHGALTPETVVVTPGARARLVDPATWGRRPAAEHDGPHALSPVAIRRDVHDLGLLLRALTESPEEGSASGRIEAIAERAIGESGVRPYRSAASLARALSLYLIGRRLRLVR